MECRMKMCCPYISRIGSTQYWKFLSFLFALEEINQDSQILPNITLGYNIHDSNSNKRGTLEALLDLLSKGEANVPNYSCEKEKNTLVVLEGAEADTSRDISNLLNPYKIPQVGFMIAWPFEGDKFPWL